MRLLSYNISVQTYQANKKPVVSPYCNGFTVRNGGNTALLVNGDPLAPGEFKSVGGNHGEIYIGRIDLVFRDQATQTLPRVRVAVVTQKFYTSQLPVSDNPAEPGYDNLMD